MKHLKSFAQITEGLTNKIVNLEINTIVNNIFNHIKSKDEFNDILDGHSLNVAHDIYDSFVDAGEILDLRQDDLQMFADNLGVGDSPNLLFAIIEKMYEEKTGRNFVDDIKSTINSLTKKVNVLDEDVRGKILGFINELKKL
ncbi:MAG: hypothetical protein ACOC3V_01420 [bacterium]